MSNAPLMPKATAVWLVDNTALSFDQIADFCKLHPLEVKGIADGEVAAGVATEPGADAAPSVADGSESVASQGEVTDGEEEGEGETLEQMRERIKLEKKQKKPTIPPELLQNANSYEDQLMVVLMIVDQ